MGTVGDKKMSERSAVVTVIFVVNTECSLLYTKLMA